MLVQDNGFLNIICVYIMCKNIQMNREKIDECLKALFDGTTK